jgi:hypothetical protein
MVGEDGRSGPLLEGTFGAERDPELTLDMMCCPRAMPILYPLHLKHLRLGFLT